MNVVFGVPNTTFIPSLYYPCYSMLDFTSYDNTK